jgi:hypothetical protein
MRWSTGAALAVAAALAACGGGGGASGNGGGSGSLDGTYVVSAVKCNGVPATGASTTRQLGQKFVFAGTLLTIQVSDASCTISRPLTIAIPSTGTMTSQATGTFSCSPTASACAALATTEYGDPAICGASHHGSLDTSTYAPASVAAGGTVTFTVSSTDTSCSRDGQADPLSVTLTKQ